MSNVVRHSIAYSYKVGDTIERFNSCNPEEQAAIEMHIAKVIVESFVEPADHDYLAARSLAIGGLHRSFYWSATQAIEKYLKAFLLLHGISVRDFSHDLSKLLEVAKNCKSGFADIDISPNSDLSLPSHFTLSQLKLDQFIQLLQKYGSPSNRYNNYGAIYDTGHLFALDSLVYRLRSKMQLPCIEMSFHMRLSADFQRYLYENNPYFAPAHFAHAELPNPLFPLSAGGNMPHWEFLQRSDTMLYLFPKQWLKKHMKINF
nr:HEPN domain-containing protein [Massilia sp. JS1662]